MGRDIQENPFTPGFGEIPYIVAGRSDIINEYADIITSNGRSQKKHPLIRGMRSYGKTVLLRELLEIAKNHGYATFYISATRGMYDNLMKNMREKAEDIDVSTTFTIAPSIDISNSSTGTTASVHGLSVTHTVEKTHVDKSLDSLVRCMLKSKRINGVAVAIDEINYGYIEDIQRIASTMQSLVSEKLPVSFIGAGLPEYIDEIQQDSSISFVRRMEPQEIGTIDFRELGDAIRTTCTDHDIEITKNALNYIVRASDGSPYIAQVFAYGAYENAKKQAWKNGNVNVEITPEDCLQSFKSSLPTIFMSLVKPTLKSLTPVEQSFLRAMAKDAKDKPTSRMGNVAKRMNETPQYANIYRRRLIEKQIICTDERGYVKCLIPYMMTYLSDEERYDKLCKPAEANVNMANKPDFWLDMI